MLTSYESLQTQSQILKAAVALFNEKGVGPVTPSMIAERAAVSAESLASHFKDKDAMIRGIFWRMDLFSRFAWAGRGPQNPKEGLTGFMRFMFGELSRYRFFFREFSSLLHNDPLLAKLWQLRYEQVFDAMRETARLWVDAGILKPFRRAADIDAFIENFWILANFSGVHIEQRSQQIPDLLVRFLYPYHTEKGQRVLDLYEAQAS